MTYNREEFNTSGSDDGALGEYGYLQHMGKIGYWEIHPTDEPPYTVHASEGVYEILSLDNADSLTVEEGFEATHPEDRKRIKQAVDRAFTNGEPWDMELRLATEDGGARWVHNVGEPVIEDGEVRFVRGLLQEITTRKRQQAELERQNERLEEFARIVSHDLRNPLTVAQGRLELAREERDNEDLEAIARAHERMAVLIEDLLTLAREGEEVKDLEPVNLDILTEECWESVDQADARLQANTGLRLEADRSRLKQLIENLVRNAIEHGGDDVTISVGELDAGFYIEDDGSGIPEEIRDDVLQPGFTISEEGIGYGLSIVKDVVEAHGWDIEVTEGSGGGARLEITGIESAQ